ncbi:carbohydrate ABC transporter substrate-binding protein, CUT1 family [Nocardioides scoriae]|uniref:Carbohydrate ABC transporter substrate-binding protein, CUT1 family n=1 Tax=Nocardioides scoriae TaxID=642780 RepID=A0A1H1MPY5_9ACTN|nr:carbohydrate ABC transporter substrate-binding protein, CUT1 family [Nocardioides scoriae]
MRVGWSLRRSVVATAALAVLTATAACTSTEQEPPAAEPTPSSSSSSSPTQDAVVLAVYGPDEVTDVYRSLAATWTSQHPDRPVRVKAYADHAEAMSALVRLRSEGKAPDLFLAGREDLADLMQTKAVRRVDDLLAQRQVDFGDGFNRTGLEAFSDQAALQCMPVDVSPLVVYYNPKLIELDEIAEPGRRPITQERGWTLEEFARAAEQPRRPGVRGLYVEPQLDQVAPFVFSGGGEVVDDTADPTTLTLSDDASRDALEQLLEVVRNPALTFGQDAIAKRSALQRFEEGKLGMLLGYRDLTAELRTRPSLTFDVMPLPSLGSGATVARITGACLSADSDQQDTAADFLATMISQESQDALAATGFTMPANLASLNDEAFLQTGQRPLHSQVFVREVRDIELLPSTTRWVDVLQVAGAQLTDLFDEPVIDPLEERLTALDAASVPLLDPDADPSQQPTPSDPSSSSTP